MPGLLALTALIASLTLQVHSFPQAAPKTNLTGNGNSIAFETIISDRIRQLRPAIPDLQIKLISAEPWEEPSDNAEDFLRINITYFVPSSGQFWETSHNPWSWDSWSTPVPSSPTWSNVKPFYWQDIKATLYGQILEQKRNDIERKYKSLVLQRLRCDFNAGNDQVYWTFEDDKDQKFWQGDVDNKIYNDHQIFARLMPSSNACSAGNAQDVKEVIATS